MYLLTARIGDHRMKFSVQTEHLHQWISARFPVEQEGAEEPTHESHLYITDF